MQYIFADKNFIFMIFLAVNVSKVMPKHLRKLICIALLDLTFGNFNSQSDHEDEECLRSSLLQACKLQQGIGHRRSLCFILESYVSCSQNCVSKGLICLKPISRKVSCIKPRKMWLIKIYSATE